MLFKEASTQWNTLGEQIAYKLRIKILSRTYAPGSMLSENQIANEYNTSRSPVRDAFKMLTGEGLIRPERMGAVVLGLDAKDLKELFEVRYLIESFALKRLAQSVNEPVLMNLERLIDKMEISAKHQNFEEFALLDYSFHETIIKSIEHNRMLLIWNSIKHVIFAVLLITTENRFKSKKDEIKQLIQKHSIVIEKLKSKDENEIENVLHEHFTDVYHSLANLL